MAQFDPATIATWQKVLEREINSVDPLMTQAQNSLSQWATTRLQSGLNNHANGFTTTTNPIFTYGSISNVEAEAIQQKLDALTKYVNDWADRNNDRLVEHGIEPLVIPEKVLAP